jgi:hypothetical protein
MSKQMSNDKIQITNQFLNPKVKLPGESFTTKTRNLENTKKGRGAYQTIFLRAFVPSCFRDWGFATVLFHIFLHHSSIPKFHHFILPALTA